MKLKILRGAIKILTGLRLDLSTQYLAHESELQGLRLFSCVESNGTASC